MKKFFQTPWYPLLFALYPIAALLAYNVGQARLQAGFRSALVSVLAAALLFVLLRLVYRDASRAAFVTAALALFFFSFGQVYDQISKKWKLPHLSLWMLALWLVLAGLAFCLAALQRLDFTKATLSLNVVALALVLYPIGQIVFWTIPQRAQDGPQHASLEALAVPAGETPPDIYYFILDSYGSAGLLQDAYGYDNRAFVSDLENQGFYVASCSQSNYGRTEISLGSSLNLDYLQNLDDTFTPDNIDRTNLWNDIHTNVARLDLERAGYKTVAFATGFAFTELDDADVYIQPSLAFSSLSEYETLLLRTTALQPLVSAGVLNLDQIDGARYRERFQTVFNSMGRLARMPGPKFVFVHVVSPHPPFVYGPDGSPTNPDDFLNADHLYPGDLYAQGYQNQVTYLNTRIEAAVATLISQSATPPVIILQGDHGPWLQTGSNQFRILNAYYLPGHEDQLYPTISPVNSFRLVFDDYLGGQYPLLRDQSYYSPTPNLYQFTPIPNPCQTH